MASFVAEIATGDDAAMMNAPREEEEWRKAITATLNSGSNIVIYDNLQYVLQSASLALALTARSWKDRILGVSQTVTIPQRCTWVATGNNIRLGGDLPRRCYWIRLDSQMSRPWTRIGFQHPNLIGWARERRGEILAALLTLARSWFAAGQPEASVPALGSFEHWAKTVGGILAHAGVRGFLGNLQEFYDLADDTTLQWESFLGEIHAGYGDEAFTVAQLSERLRTDQTVKDSLPTDLSGAWGDRDTASGGFKVKLGKAFQVRVGTRYGNDGLFLERAGTESKGKQVRWRVVRAGVQGLQVSSLPSRELLIDVAQADSTETPLPTLQPCASPYCKEEVLAAEPKRDRIPPEHCFSCGGTRFRKLRDGGWVCEACHPVQELDV